LITTNSHTSATALAAANRWLLASTGKNDDR
jgi:hypothetical protein